MQDYAIVDKKVNNQSITFEVRPDPKYKVEIGLS